jgi:predicted Zn-dependent peptidase
MTVGLTTLPSGLRIVTDDMPGLETAAIAVHVGVGSRHESEREHGLSHLLEHMAFKGTWRRSARAIAEQNE